MLYEALKIAEAEHGGMKALLLASLVMTTSETVLEFFASAFTPFFFEWWHPGESRRAKALSVFSMEVYCFSAGVGIVIYPLIGGLIHAGDQKGLWALSLLMVLQNFQYSFLNQIGDQALEIAKPHWLKTFDGLTRRFPACLSTCSDDCLLRRPANADSLSVLLTLMRILLAFIIGGLYLVLRSSPIASFTAVTVMCAFILCACTTLLRSDVSLGIVNEEVSQEDGSMLYNWPQDLPHFDLRLVIFSVAIFNLPVQAFNAIVALIILRLSKMGYGVVVVLGLIITVSYFLFTIRKNPGGGETEEESPESQEFQQWLYLQSASVFGLVGSSLLLLFVVTEALLVVVIPLLLLYVTANYGMHARFTRFLFVFPEDRSSAVVYWSNVLYVLVSGPLLALNWVLISLTDDDFTQAAFVAGVAGVGYATFAFGFAVLPGFRTGVEDIASTASPGFAPARR